SRPFNSTRTPPNEGDDHNNNPRFKKRNNLHMFFFLNEVLAPPLAHLRHLDDTRVAEEFPIIIALLVHALVLRIPLLDTAAALETEVDQASRAAIRFRVHRYAAGGALSCVADASICSDLSAL